MELYPAIDLSDGRCVRLAQGDFGRETIYDADPVSRAKAFESAGARWLHVVDLDAARTGLATNRPVVAAIAAAVGIPVQAGGGVRRVEDIAELLDAGVARALVGTPAIMETGFLARAVERWPGQVAAAVDHRDGEVRVKGWSEASGRGVVAVVSELAAAGAAAVMVTGISRDGLMIGPDLVGYRQLLEHCDVPLVASGGVGTLDDIRRLERLQGGGRHLAGVIVGRAIYEDRFTVAEAVAASLGVPT